MNLNVQAIWGGSRWKSICKYELTHSFVMIAECNVLSRQTPVSMSKSPTNHQNLLKLICDWLLWKPEEPNTVYRIIFTNILTFFTALISHLCELWFHKSDFYQFKLRSKLNFIPVHWNSGVFGCWFVFYYRTTIGSKLMSQFWSPCLVTMFDVPYFWFVLWCPLGSPSRSSYATAASGPTTPRPGVQQI